MHKASMQITIQIDGIEGLEAGSFASEQRLQERTLTELFEKYYLIRPGATGPKITVRAEIEPGAVTRHKIKLTKYGYTIEHPLSCRPKLFNCPFNESMADLLWDTTMPEPGIYYATFDKRGELHLEPIE